MPTSQVLFPSGMTDEHGVIPSERLSYFRERLRNRLHELVLLEFLYQEDKYHLTKRELAERIGRRAEQVTRWLGAPGNWTLDTVSDLLLGMASEPDFEVAKLRDKIANAVKRVAEPKQEPARSLNDMISPPKSFQSDSITGTAKAANVKSF